MGAVVSHHLSLVSTLEHKGEQIIATANRQAFALGFSSECVSSVCGGLDNFMGDYR
ncbi:hypothetical protein PSCICJ_50690 [Pseudomonas cichorii]|nr:hypothetical protein PSCICJ_50690 [Pseudomonas cichorii]